MKLNKLIITNAFKGLIGILFFCLSISWGAQPTLGYRLERVIPAKAKVFNLGRIRAIDMAADNSLWASDDYGAVLHFTADGILLTKFRAYDAGSNTLKVKAGKDSSVWVLIATNDNSYYLRHFDSQGKFINQLVDEGNKNYHDFTVARDGSLWIANDSGVRQFSPEGRLIRTLTQDNEGFALYQSPGPIVTAADGSIWLQGDNGLLHSNFDNTGFNRLTGKFEGFRYLLAIAPNGNIYANGCRSSFCSQKFLNGYTPDGESLYQNYFDNIISPFSMVFADDGSFLVSNMDLKHYSSTGKELKFINKLSYNAYDPYSALTLFSATDEAGVWVYGWQDKAIKYFNADGIFQRTLNWQVDGFIPALATAKDGGVWLVEQIYKSNNDFSNLIVRLIHLDINGKLLSQTDREFIKPDDANYLNMEAADLAVAKDGSVWLSLMFGSGFGKRIDRIEQFDAKGNLVHQFGPITNTSGYPYNISTALDNSLWLTSSLLGKVINITAEGNILSQFNASNSNDLAVSPDGTIWVATYTDVQRFSQDGQLLEQLSANSENTDFFGSNYPVVEKISIAANGALWVKNYNGMLGKFTVPQTSLLPTYQYKAVILAGDQANGNIVDVGRWRTSITAHQALQWRGLDSYQEILLLSAGNTQLDLNNNGLFDDIKAASKQQLQQAVTEWAKDSQDLVIFLTGQGKPEGLQINASETLTPEELAAWLTELEKSLPGKITVVLEADYAGNFLKKLSRPDRPRIVVASSAIDQRTTLINQGVNSFANHFWSHIMDGAPVFDAFQAAKQITTQLTGAAQNPQFDADGDGVATANDNQAMANYCIGPCAEKQNPALSIQPLAVNKVTLKDSTSLDFTVTIQHAEDVAEVWALLQRPGNDKAVSLEKIPLSCQDKTLCTGRYYRFHTAGTYQFNFFALDMQHRVSDPVILQVTQPQTQTITPAEYIAQDNRLYLYDVQIGSGHYQANIQLNNKGLYQVQSLIPTQETITPAAQLNFSSGLLTVPEARVNGQVYQGSFKWVDNYLLQLLEATAIAKP